MQGMQTMTEQQAADVAREFGQWVQQCAANLQNVAIKHAKVNPAADPCECIEFGNDAETRVYEMLCAAEERGRLRERDACAKLTDALGPTNVWSTAIRARSAADAQSGARLAQPDDAAAAVQIAFAETNMDADLSFEDWPELRDFCKWALEQRRAHLALIVERDHMISAGIAFAKVGETDRKLREAAEAEREANCGAICTRCASGNQPKKYGAEWVHKHGTDGIAWPCTAQAIRARSAPQPVAPQGEAGEW